MEGVTLLESLFAQIGALLVLAAVVGAIGTLLRQPLIISFIVVGIVAGPSGLGLASDNVAVEMLAQVGIALLLFVVGLKLDLSNIRTMGPVALAVGMGQVIFTALFGFLIALALRMSVAASVYVAVALALSSTIIIIKLLTDKREIDSLHGRITVGVLIVQDIVVIAAMIVLAALGAMGGAQGSLLTTMGTVALKSGAYLLGLGLFTRYAVPRLTRFLSRSQELLVLFAVAWAVFLALCSEHLGLSKEVGAFLAGVALASTPYRDAIGARLVSLRDFLLLFFFIELGASLDLSLMHARLAQSVGFSLFILIGNPLIVMAIMGVMGYRSRTGFFTGVAMAQISEFSLLIGALGVSLGHIDKDILGLITLVGLVTIGLSTYLIMYSRDIYNFLSRGLSLFERRTPFREIAALQDMSDAQVDVIVVGMGRYGSNIAHCLRLRRRRVLGVDFDPDALSALRDREIPMVFGDATDPELLEHLPLSQSRVIVCAAPDLEVNTVLVRLLRQQRYAGRVALTAHTPRDAEILRKEGGDLILRPFVDAAEQAADAVAAAAHPIHERLDLPVGLANARIPPGSRWLGRPLRDVPLRSETGVSVLAVSRAGRAMYDPDPELTLFPGDHIILVGAPSDLLRAQESLQEQEFADEEEGEFVIESLCVDSDSPWAGRTLAEIAFRSRFNATVIAIERDEDRVLTPRPDERLQVGDRLFVAGRGSVLQDIADARPCPTQRPENDATPR